eukprot:SAG31_NODE_30606_length_378_cov_2.716846_1_plen_55_part_01
MIIPRYYATALTKKYSGTPVIDFRSVKTGDGTHMSTYEVCGRHPGIDTSVKLCVF